jgi:hypothetical protein
LYGSGTTPAAVQQGDQYVATFSGSLADGDRDNSTLFCVRLGGQGTGIRLVILDRTELPDGSYFESYYLGWTMQGDGVLNAFTYRRIKAIIAWVLDNYQQINRNAVLIGGGSMGGWARCCWACGTLTCSPQCSRVGRGCATRCRRQR